MSKRKKSKSVEIKHPTYVADVRGEFEQPAMSLTEAFIIKNAAANGIRRIVASNAPGREIKITMSGSRRLCVEVCGRKYDGRSECYHFSENHWTHDKQCAIDALREQQSKAMTALLRRVNKLEHASKAEPEIDEFPSTPAARG